jgi:hypothetical protein
MEHRCGSRFSVDLPILVLGRDVCILEARLFDVSMSGALLESALPLRVFAQIEVVLEPFNCTFQPLERLPAFVTRLVAGKHGVEWEHFAPPGIAHRIRRLSNSPRRAFDLEALLDRGSRGAGAQFRSSKAFCTPASPWYTERAGYHSSRPHTSDLWELCTNLGAGSRDGRPEALEVK